MNVATKHRVSKLFAVALAFLMMAVLLAGALPAYAVPYTLVTPSQAPTFTKYLVVDDGVKAPPVTFSYTISAGQAAGTYNSMPVYAGNDASVSGTPKLKVGDGASAATVSLVFNQSSTTTNGDGSVVSADKDYASGTVSVDFTGVTFSKPGIFHFVVTESVSGNSSVSADTNNTRDLYVSVVNKDDNSMELEVTGCAFVDLSDGTKTASFMSTVNSYGLKLEKQVTGNQGDRSKAFEFTVNVDGVDGTVYTVDLSHASSATTAGDSTTLTAGQDGTYHLADDEYIVIKGIAGQVSYTIAEDDYTTDGYTTSHNGGGTQESRTATGSISSATEITFTNRKQGNVPTGIIMEVAPFALLAIIVGAAFVLLVATRKHRSR